MKWHKPIYHWRICTYKIAATEPKMAFGLVDEVVLDNDDGQKLCRLSSFCRMQEVLLTLPTELDGLHIQGSLILEASVHHPLALSS
jgi:hypothetical protein